MTRSERARLLDRARREGEADGRANERERMEGEIALLRVKLDEALDYKAAYEAALEDIRAMGRALAEAVRRTP